MAGVGKDFEFYVGFYSFELAVDLWPGDKLGNGIMEFLWLEKIILVYLY